jgi:hypothetical protein
MYPTVPSTTPAAVAGPWSGLVVVASPPDPRVAPHFFFAIQMSDCARTAP